jgi:DNA-directed RNA polymerase specialized sigma24 family protein
MSEQLLNEINQNLEVLIRLKAFELIHGRAQREQIQLLSQVGFTPKEIGEMLGTSANTVSVELSRFRRETKGKRGGAR